MELDEKYKAYRVEIQQDGNVLVYQGNHLFLHNRFSTEGMFQDAVALKLAIQALIDVQLLFNESEKLLDDAIKKIGGDISWKPMD